MGISRAALRLACKGILLAACLIAVTLNQGCATREPGTMVPSDPSKTPESETTVDETTATPTSFATQTTQPTVTLTPAPQNCSWTWAYAEGSPELDETAQKDLATTGIVAGVRSSSYGEINSCDNSFHPMCLDFVLEVQTVNLKDLEALSSLAGTIAQVLDENLNTADVTIICSTNITFTNGVENRVCSWDQDTLTCYD